MAPAPDTVGRELTNAQRLLAAAGWQAKVEQSGPPPPHQVPTGLLRVIQQRCSGERCVVLTVAPHSSLAWDKGD